VRLIKDNKIIIYINSYIIRLSKLSYNNKIYNISKEKYNNKNKLNNISSYNNIKGEVIPKG
jgi:hypothetical protein